MQRSNQYQISYSVFSKCMFVSYIKFSIQVWLLILYATAATIVDLLCITISCMSLHVCHALLFHTVHQRNIEQTFHVSLTWPQQVCVHWNALHCSHMRLCIKQRDSHFLPSLGVVSVVSGGENGGQKSWTLHRWISIKNWDPLDHRYQTAWKGKD